MTSVAYLTSSKGLVSSFKEVEKIPHVVMYFPVSETTKEYTKEHYQKIAEFRKKLIKEKKERENN